MSGRTSCRVCSRFDVFHAQRCARHFAAALGFAPRACLELAIVASELSSNMVKYGGGGTLDLAEITTEYGASMELSAHDSGPPFRNFEMALLDGYDDQGPIDPGALLRRGGIGGGLGAVARLTHSVRVEGSPDGKRVIAVRHLAVPLRPVFDSWPAND